jgi:hypothetical protein
LKSTTDCNERKPENLIECQPDIEKKGDTTILTALLNIPETYPNMPQQKYDSYGIRLPSPQIAFRDLVQQLTTGPALRCFLRKGYKVYIRRSDDKLYPCLYEMDNDENQHGLLTYGHRYPLSAVCADACLKHKHRVHAPISTSEFSGNIVVLSQRYKQCPAKIDELVVALDESSMADDNLKNPDVGSGYGKFGGNITIMGSGGSNRIMGHFAPTTKSSKDDALVVVGMGQNRSSRINKQFEKLVGDNAVRAVFLNEHQYRKQKNGLDDPQSLRFLGYYEFIESRFVSGNTLDEVKLEFENPTENELDNLTFRLHPHLRLEARPFIPTLAEASNITSDDHTSYTKLVFDAEDHSDILYDLPSTTNWKSLSREISIEDVIKHMITSGKLSQYIIDGDLSDEVPQRNHDDNSHDSDDQLDTLTTDYMKCNPAVAPEFMAWCDDTDQQSYDAGNETDESDYAGNETYESDSENNSDYQPSHYDSDDELESLTKEDTKRHAVIVPEVEASCYGTAASITEIIYSCFFVAPLFP